MISTLSKWLLVILFSTPFLSCTSSSSSLITLKKDFQYTFGEIAMFPSQLDVISMGGLSHEVADSADEYLYRKLMQRSQSKWISHKLIMSDIEKIGLMEEYNAFVSEYQKTGIQNKNGIAEIGRKMKIPYISVSKIRQAIITANDVKRFSDYRYIYIIFQILSTQNGEVVLEISGNAKCGSDIYDIESLGVIKLAIDEIVNEFPGVSVY